MAKNSIHSRYGTLRRQSILMLSMICMLGVPLRASADTWDDAANESDSDESPTGSFSDDFGRDSRSGDIDDPAPKKIKAPSFPGYGPYSRDFRLLCEGMQRDGRSAMLATILLAKLRKDPECPGCYPFFRGIMVQCKAKKVSTVKKTEAVPQPRLQREPNMAVRMVVEDLASRLSEDEKRGPATTMVLKQFRKLLSEEPNLTPGARDYFDMVLTSLEAPFQTEEHKEQLPGSQNEGGAAVPEISVDDIFEGDV